MILRDRDANTAWTATADAIDRRWFTLQNWRSHISLLTDASGAVRERYEYSAYSVPWGILAGDLDYDGDSDNTDGAILEHAK